MDRCCRSCLHRPLEPILSLGTTPLANAFLLPEQLPDSEPRFPLELVFCPLCTLLQITETVPPEMLFTEYLYFSSISDTMLRHAQELVADQMRRRSLNGKSLVIEIGSNDGYLLQYYRERGIAVLGIEPSRNVALFAREKRNIPTWCEFFGAPIAKKLAEGGQQADIIHANNVMAHVADLNGFVEGVRILLKPDGVAVIEVPYVRDLIQKVEFDTIYHEHLCYFSLTALDHLFRRHQMQVVKAEQVPIHGGSLRVSVAHQAQSDLEGAGAAVGRILNEEQAAGMNELRFYQSFRNKVECLRQNLVALLRQLRSQNQTIAAYGASAKGTTLLNYFGIGRELIDFVVDRSPMKQGRYTPGTRLPIHSPEKLLEARPDYVLLLTWNFADEILEQQAQFRARGGHFIIPVPEVRIV